MKNKVNGRYINILLVMLIILVTYVLSPLWSSILRKVFLTFLPILIAFSLAFILNPIVSFLEKKAKLPRIVSILGLYVSIISLVLFIIFGLVKPAVGSLANLSIGLENLLDQVGKILNIDTSGIAVQLGDVLEKVYVSIFNFFTATGESAEDVIGVVISGAVVVIVGIIFLMNFNQIISKTADFLKTKEDPTIYLYVRNLYRELTNYLSAEIIIAGIQFVEYTTLFLLIGIFNPAYLEVAFVLGFTAAIFSLVPYFGGYLSSAFMILLGLSLPHAFYSFIPIGVFMLIFPNLDAYVINPMIYKKQMKLNPILSISAILLGQTMFGIIGVIISIPLVLVLNVTFDFYKMPIKAKLKQFKDSL